MKNIYLFGECMIELKGRGADSMAQSFAGDVFNSAVYLKRMFPDVNTHLLTAVGQDHFSDEMIKYINAEQVSTDFVFRSDTKIPGLYAISVDSEGERSFTYWRNDSAARTVMTFIDDDVTQTLTKGDVFFFSGISLAVIHPQDRDAFWCRLVQLKTAGVQIVFDPNYRARLWQSIDETHVQYHKAFELSDMVLPGVEDFETLYDLTTAEQVLTFLSDFNIAEIVLKNGPASVYTVHNGETQEHKITPVEHVVDTTSAGDSFNGTYIGARLTNNNIKESISLASKAAGFVIQHKGAIVPKNDFQLFLETIT